MPFDIVAAPLLPGREDLEAPQADADLGRVGVGRPDAADGALVRALADAGHPVEDERPEAGFGHGQGGRRADAPGADDDDVVEAFSAAAMVALLASSLPANVPSGTSMNSGRLGWSTMSFSGDALFPEQAVDEGRAGLGPAGAHAGPGDGLDLVDVAESLRMRARISPAVTRSQRQTMMSSAVRST